MPLMQIDKNQGYEFFTSIKCREISWFTRFAREIKQQFFFIGLPMKLSRTLQEPGWGAYFLVEVKK